MASRAASPPARAPNPKFAQAEPSIHLRFQGHNQWPGVLIASPESTDVVRRSHERCKLARTRHAIVGLAVRGGAQDCGAAEKEAEGRGRVRDRLRSFRVA